MNLNVAVLTLKYGPYSSSFNVIFRIKIQMLLSDNELLPSRVVSWILMAEEENLLSEMYTFKKKINQNQLYWPSV